MVIVRALDGFVFVKHNKLVYPWYQDSTPEWWEDVQAYGYVTALVGQFKFFVWAGHCGDGEGIKPSLAIWLDKSAAASEPGGPNALRGGPSWPTAQWWKVRGGKSTWEWFTKLIQDAKAGAKRKINQDKQTSWKRKKGGKQATPSPSKKRAVSQDVEYSPGKGDQTDDDDVIFDCSKLRPRRLLAEGAKVEAQGREKGKEVSKDEEDSDEEEEGQEEGDEKEDKDKEEAEDTENKEDKEDKEDKDKGRKRGRRRAKLWPWRLTSRR
ncbi:hypothetical protein RHS01_11501 [Rhizoctonia solani]|uniref:Uncharacterized protein n=1 Tax=Rhizoctonia solani TaxID=456999 RepID=A0A8H7I2Y9_9AGAM|nr:hypothetical protein RHS01_11501 [Rhizoctonia solani]